jgi:phage shock protein E
MLSMAVVFAACGSQPATTDNVPPSGAVSGKVNDISPKDAFPKTQAAYAQFIDVRTPAEYADGHADRAINIPLATIAENLDRIEKNEPVYIICNTGRQSTEAGQILTENGYPVGL